MTKLNSRTLLRTSTTKISTSVIAVTCITLLVALGIATIIGGGSNHILYTTVSAQVVDREELREELRAGIAKELQEGVNQNQSDQPAPATSPDGLTLSLDRAHFIP
jgi:signal transduction histidine kinase